MSDPAVGRRKAAVSQLFALIAADTGTPFSVVLRGRDCCLTIDIPPEAAPPADLPDSIDLLCAGDVLARQPQTHPAEAMAAAVGPVALQALAEFQPGHATTGVLGDVERRARGARRRKGDDDA